MEADTDSQTESAARKDVDFCSLLGEEHGLARGKPDDLLTFLIGLYSWHRHSVVQIVDTRQLDAQLPESLGHLFVSDCSAISAGPAFRAVSLRLTGP